MLLAGAGQIMHAHFFNRVDAGRQLAAKLAKYAGPEVLVLALPRGGVPVAAEVARTLSAPLDVLVVRKLGLPGNEELAMGAIASGGLRVVNAEIIAQHGVSAQTVATVAAREQRELTRREKTYREGRPAPVIRGQTVVLVDDGVATGSSMRVAIAALREAKAGRIIAAAPVMSRDSYFELRSAADECVALSIPRDFGAVGEFYAEFGSTTDEEVGELLHTVAACAPPGVCPQFSLSQN